MCRNNSDSGTGISRTMSLPLHMIISALCVYVLRGIDAAPPNIAISTDTDKYSSTLRSESAQTPDVTGAVDGSHFTKTQSSFTAANLDTTTIPRKRQTANARLHSDTFGVPESSTIPVSTSTKNVPLSTTRTASDSISSDSTFDTKRTTSTSQMVKSYNKTTGLPVFNSTSVQRWDNVSTALDKKTPRNSSTEPRITNTPGTSTTISTSVVQNQLKTTATDTHSKSATTISQSTIADNSVMSTQSKVSTDSNREDNISAGPLSTKSTSPSGSNGTVTVVGLPVTGGENGMEEQTTQQAAQASHQIFDFREAATASVTDSPTFETVDTQSSQSVSDGDSNTTPVLSGAANASPGGTGMDNTTEGDVSSGDDLSTFLAVSTYLDTSPSLDTSTVTQTTVLNTSSVQSVLTTDINTASGSSTVSQSTVGKTVGDDQTNNVLITTPRSPTIADEDGSTADKNGERKPDKDQKSLTTILLVLCASLMALIIGLCVFTYVKFRKKSRSIRKRLTFKDDAIYDNPIYHGRWEVPKAPEPATSSYPRSLPMLVSALPDEVVRLSKDEDTGFRLQFMMLDKLSPSSPRQVATTDMNIHKNRYRDILPFDHNRVKLEEEGDKSDYINASFVPGVKSEREYVAAQGPLERTAADHWKMIWELNIRVIAMLTTCEEGDLIFKAKCCQYWPNKENESVNYDGIYITLVSTARLCRENYKLKVLHIRKGKDAEPRKVQLFQYIKWPDRKNPDDPEAFLEYRDHVKREMAAFDDQCPLLVHCSAGVGRTGTFIAIDTLLQHMEERESIDVYGLVLRLRKYRVLLVQNASQYKFVHACLLMKLDKLKKAEIDEGRKKAGLDDSYPYENMMVMGQRAVVGELGGLVHGGDDGGDPLQQSSAVQSFLRKTKTNVQPDWKPEDQMCRSSDGMPSPVKVEEWPRPLSDPVPRPVIETTPKSKPYPVGTKGDPERALAKELGGMFQVAGDKGASPGKTAAIKAFLRNRDLETESTMNNTNSDINNHGGDSLVIDNRFREDGEKQTTCL